MGVVRTGQSSHQRSQNLHIVRKAEPAAHDGVPEVIEGRATERVDSRMLLTQLEEGFEAEATVTNRPALPPVAEPPKPTSKLAHTLRRAGSPTTPAQGTPSTNIAKGSTPLIEPMRPTAPIDAPRVTAEGSGSHDPLPGPPAVPQPVTEASTAPQPAFEAVFDASKLLEPLRRHGERVAEIAPQAPRIRPSEIALGLLLGGTIVAGAWLTIASLL